MRLHTRQGLLHFGMASGAMMAAFAVCEGLNHLVSAEHALVRHMHAVFLPHGVVVLFAWIYGWAAMPLLFPAALLSAYVLAGPVVLGPVILFVLAVKLVAVSLAFDLFRLAGMDARGPGAAANWKMLVAVGLLGSILGNVPRVTVGPCCTQMDLWGRLGTYLDTVAGDMAGLVIVLVALMLFFRVQRHG